MEKEKSYQERMCKTTDYKFDAIKEYLKDGIKILDYGSGYNPEFIKKVKETGAKYFAYDIDENVVNKLKNDNVDVIGSEEIKSLQKQFDIIYMSSVLHEIESYQNESEKEQTFKIIDNLLKPDGLLIIRDFSFAVNQVNYPSTLQINSKESLDEIKKWIEALHKNQIISDCGIDDKKLQIHFTTESDMLEVMFHSVWGLQSLQRESRERYGYNGILYKHLFSKYLAYEFVNVREEFDKTYDTYLKKYFTISSYKASTKAIYYIRKKR